MKKFITWIKNKKYFTAYFMAIIGIICVFSVATFSLFHNISVQTPQNIIISNAINTDFVITDSSLGGVSAAITLSKQKQKFVMLSASNSIGGQATEQGVSTLDYWSRPFQNNSVLAGILDNMSSSNSTDPSKTYVGKYSGNAIYGPGDTPKNIENYLKSQIDPKYGQILYNSRITDIEKTQNTISSIKTINSDNQAISIKAKYFLDSSDTAALTRLSTIPWNYGLDTQEITGERIALKSGEKDKFVKTFGNRTQPVTTPFVLFDKGYSGVRFTAKELSELSQTQGNQVKAQIPCTKQVCVEAKDNFDQNIAFEKDQKYTRLVLTFVQTGEQKLAKDLLEASFSINDQIAKPKIYPTSDNIHYQVELVANFESNLKLSIKTTKPLKLLEVIADYKQLQPVPPKGYNADEFGKIMKTKNPGGKLIQKDSPIGKFMGARKIVDYENLSTNPSIPKNIAERANFDSQGISQINTDQNDFLFQKIDQDKFLNDFQYRKEQNQKSKQWSQFYAYWLLYNSEGNMLDCPASQAFCNTARFEVLPIGMNTDDGYANTPYIRDPVRPVGKKILTYQDLALIEHVCNSEQNTNQKCTELDLVNKEMQPREGVMGVQKYKIDSSWLENFDSESLYGFEYFIDLHSLIDTSNEKENLQAYYNQIQNDGRLKGDLPLFLGQEHSRLARPGTVSLSNLYSDKVDNLLFCGKNISVSQLANSITRLHPAESATGQSCGVIAKLMLENQARNPDDLKQKISMSSIQLELIKDGMWILPIEDMELRSMPPEVLNSIYQAILKKQLPIKTTQYKDKNLKFLFDISEKADTDSIKVDLQSEKVKQLIKEYQTQTKLKLKDSKDSTAITKGELAWVLYKL